VFSEFIAAQRQAPHLLPGGDRTSGQVIGSVGPSTVEEKEEVWWLARASQREQKSQSSRGCVAGPTFDLSPSLRFIQLHIKRLLEQIGDTFKVVYFIFDGELGHNDALQMAQQVGLHLISKLRYNSALYIPYNGPYSGRGPRRKYGQKLDYQNIPSEYLKATSIDKEIKTQIYQMSLWHKKFADLLNIVVIVLFSSDLELGYEHMIDYYRLRFQLEFNFRDAKQYWGLEDFMSVKERPVYNSANLAMFMVNLSHALIRPMRNQWPAFSVNDLKAWFRGRKYATELLKLLPESPGSIFIDQVVAQMAELGRINHATSPS
jgi:putative transposase